MSQTDSEQTVRLDGELTIFRASELRTQLLPVAEQGGAVAVNLAGVIEVDMAGVQLLLALKKSIEAGGGTVQLTSLSDVVRQAIDRMGLVEELAV